MVSPAFVPAPVWVWGWRFDLGQQFQRALLSLHDNRRGEGGCSVIAPTDTAPTPLCMQERQFIVPSHQQGRRPHETAQLEMAGSIHGERLPFFRHFSAPCLKRNHFLFPKGDAHIVHFFIVYVKSFLNDRNIAKWLVWSLCSSPRLDSFSDETSEISHR